MCKKKMWKAIVVFGISVFTGILVEGQSPGRSFQVAFPLGGNLAQVQGDPYTGMRKWGLSTGVEGIATLAGGKQLSLGMLFQQLGAAPSITERKQYEQNYIDMRLSYIEVPLTLLFPLNQSKAGGRMDAELGFSFARQLSSRVVRTTTVSGGSTPGVPYLDIVDRQGTFENFVWTGVAGFSYYLHEQVALRLRYHHGISAFFKPPANDQEEGLNPLRHRYLSMSLRYIIL